MAGAGVAIASGLRRALGGYAERAAEGGAVQLVLRVDGDVEAAERALLAAVIAVQDEYAEAGAASGALDPPDAGEWTWVRDGAGLVVVTVRDCNALRPVLGAVVEGLGARGVAGELGVWRAPRIADPPLYGPLLSCRLWAESGGAAFDAVVAAVDRWSRGGGFDAVHAVNPRRSPWLPAATTDEVLARVREGIAGEGPIAVASVAAGGEGFRAFQAMGDGAVVAVVGADGGWRDELAALLGLLREVAPAARYGALARGWDVVRVITNAGLPADWPALGLARSARTGPFATEAYGAQLLAAAVPAGAAGPDWGIEHPAPGRTLVAHADAAAWFAAPFIPYNSLRRVTDRAVPPLLAAAREQLAPFLV